MLWSMRRYRRVAGLLLLPLVLSANLFSACTPGGGVTGTYEAKTPEGTFTIMLANGGKAEMTMQENGGQPDTTKGEYTVDGKNVTIQAPGGVPLVLVKTGNSLDASMMGQVLHFVKK